MGLDLSCIKEIDQLKNYPRHELIKYLNRNRAGTQIENMMDLQEKDIEYISQNK